MRNNRLLRALPVPALALLALLAGANTALAQAHVTLPLQEQGSLDGAPYKIRVPANWNGTLLVFAHGYRDAADHPGEVDNRTADAAPGGTPFEDFLLAQGYGLAGSAFRENGFAVKQGVQNSLALANFFKGRVGKPRRTILWGASLGSIVTLESIERFPGTYDGAVALCTVGAGTPRTLDLFLVLQIAYDVTFGWPAAWGRVGAVREDLDFETEVAPVLIAQLSNPANIGKFEFIRLVTRTPMEGFYPNFLFTDMFFATEAAAEFARRTRGNPAQNLDHIYTLGPAEKGYLQALGVNADPLLAAMSARRFAADPSARNYGEHYAEFTGHINRPVLSFHTRADGLIPAFHETAYRDTVADAGRSHLLLQVFNDSAGHCNFSAPQLFIVVQALDGWIQTGVRPPDAAFPAAFGFLPGFQPPPFPHQ